MYLYQAAILVIIKLPTSLDFDHLLLEAATILVNCYAENLIKNMY